MGCARLCESQGEPAGTDLSGVILSVLFHGGSGKTERHHQEHDAGNLKPKKMKDMDERPGGSTNGADGGVHSPAAACHIAKHAKRDSSRS